MVIEELSKNQNLVLTIEEDVKEDVKENVKENVKEDLKEEEELEEITIEEADQE